MNNINCESYGIAFTKEMLIKIGDFEVFLYNNHIFATTSQISKMFGYANSFVSINKIIVRNNEKFLKGKKGIIEIKEILHYTENLVYTKCGMIKSKIFNLSAIKYFQKISKNDPKLISKNINKIFKFLEKLDKNDCKENEIDLKNFRKETIAKRKEEVNLKINEISNIHNELKSFLYHNITIMIKYEFGKDLSKCPNLMNYIIINNKIFKQFKYCMNNYDKLYKQYKDIIKSENFIKKVGGLI